MRLISAFAIAAVVFAGGVSANVATAAGRGGGGFHGSVPAAVHAASPHVMATPHVTSTIHAVSSMGPRSGGPLSAMPKASQTGGRAGGYVGGGPPIAGAPTQLPGTDSVANCVHASGMSGYTGTAQAGPFIHSCAFGQ
jgi:hypothetical protein